MSNDWAAVDDLMRELGSVRQAARLIRAESAADAAVNRAIAEAAEAVNQTIDSPRNPAKLMAARDAIGVAEEVILALDREIGRSLRVRAALGRHELFEGRRSTGSGRSSSKGYSLDPAAPTAPR